MKKWDPRYDAAGKTRDNYWAGAKKACDELGMSLPDKSKLQSLAKKKYAEKEQLGIPIRWVWSSSEYLGYAADGVDLFDGRTNGSYKHYYNNVLCVGDQVFLKVYRSMSDLQEAGIIPRFSYFIIRHTEVARAQG